MRRHLTNRGLVDLRDVPDIEVVPLEKGLSIEIPDRLVAALMKHGDFLLFLDDLRGIANTYEIALDRFDWSKLAKKTKDVSRRQGWLRPDAVGVGDQLWSPRIAVVGVGGSGGNAVNKMIAAALEGVEFIVANADAQALGQSLADRRVQLGIKVTQGLGAGARPEVGRQAAEEALPEILQLLDGANMVFVTAGMGGGTGTGAAPVIAAAAREQGILTIGVVTKPFHFEGRRRMQSAEQGILELEKVVDTLIVIPNQNLFKIANEKTTFADAFKMADDVLYKCVRAITDLMVMPGLVNLDFADIRNIVRAGGSSVFGTADAEGLARARIAAEHVSSSLLLDDQSIGNAKGLLINITGGLDMTLHEVDEATNRIREEVDADANIIFGSTFDASMHGRLRVSAIATGISSAMDSRKLHVQVKEAEPAQSSAPIFDKEIVKVLAGDLEVRLARTAAEIDAAQALRYRIFYEEMKGQPPAEIAARQRDFDAFDDVCDHLLVLDRRRGEGPESIMGTYRLIRRTAAAKVGQFYSSAEYDIQKVLDYPGEVLELGRSCIAKEMRNTATMQMLWRGIAVYAYHYNVKVMFGCATLAGTDPSQHAAAMSYLYHNYLAPPEIRVRALESRYVKMDVLNVGTYDPQKAQAQVPPLIRGYLRLGGSVGDGAVIDSEFNTTDVFIILKTELVTKKYLKHYDSIRLVDDEKAQALE